MWLLLCSVVLLLTVLWIVRKLHFDHKDCPLHSRLDGKVVIITGANRGIGFATTAELAQRGARIIMACRDLGKAEAAKSDILRQFGGRSATKDFPRNLSAVEEEQIICEELDLESPKSIRNFVSRMLRHEQHIDILINNAAVNFSKPRIGKDGIESHLKVNHLAHFLLTGLLFPLLNTATDGARVINISSFNHRLAELNMDDLSRPAVGTCYSSSKLANVIHARELSERWKEFNIVAVSVHPGLVKTELFQHMPWTRWVVHHLLGWLAKTPLQGSQTVVYCCLADDLVPGGYYHECRQGKVNPQALKKSVGTTFWLASEHLIEQWEAAER